MDYAEEEIREMKKTTKGKYALWKAGCKKFKEDPPIYRIHMMQGLMTKITIYCIIFATIYATSIGLWIFGLILLPVGTIGNYYSYKGKMMQYKSIVKQYKISGVLPPIEKDISNLRRKWRIIEEQIGFFGIDIICIIYLAFGIFVYFYDYTLIERISLMALGLIPIVYIYFGIIYRICNMFYRRGKC